VRAVVRRVTKAIVRVEGEIVGRISSGLLVYLGISSEDDEGDLSWLSAKVAGLRIFDDEEGRMNLSVIDVDGEILVVSQFTLFGNVRKGFRPSFNRAAPPERGQALYERFVDCMIGELGKPVPTGRFGAYMEVEAVDDGPVTVLIDSLDKKL